MENGNKYGTDWQSDEIGIVVSAYFEMLSRDLRREKVNKASTYRDLSILIGRTNKSVERKFRNISAVLAKLEEPWITGLLPDNNFQKALSEAIDFQLSSIANQHTFSANFTLGLEEMQAEFTHFSAIKIPQIEYVPIPTLVPKKEVLPDHMERLIRKFDPVMRDFRAQQTGEAGERLIVENERAKLRQAGMPELAKKVSWISKEIGDGAGYDVKSFDEKGREKFIEVKTTIGSQTTPFFMTRNEKDFAEEADERYRIIRIFNFHRQPKAFELTIPLESFVRFTPESYRASFS